MQAFGRALEDALETVTGLSARIIETSSNGFFELDQGSITVSSREDAPWSLLLPDWRQWIYELALASTTPRSQDVLAALADLHLSFLEVRFHLVSLHRRIIPIALFWL